MTTFPLVIRTLAFFPGTRYRWQNRQNCLRYTRSILTRCRIEIRRASATHRSLTSGSSGKNSPALVNRRAILSLAIFLDWGGWERLTIRSSFSLTGMAGVSFVLWDYHDDPDTRITRALGNQPWNSGEGAIPCRIRTLLPSIISRSSQKRRIAWGRQRCSMARMRAASNSSSSSSSTFTHA